MIHVVHLAFCRTEASIKAFERLLPELRDKDYKFYCVDLSYPLNKGDDLRKYFLQAPKATYMKLDNLGHMNNIAFMTKLINGGEDEAVLFWDHDHLIEPRGWLSRMLSVLHSDKLIGYVTTKLDGKQEYYDNQGEKLCLGGETCAKLSWPGGWPIGLHRATFHGIEAIRDYYGGGEKSVLDALVKAGMYGVMMEGLVDKRACSLVDKDYQDWKNHVTCKRSQVTFKQYLEGRRC